MPGSNDVRSFWQTEAERRLPPKAWVIERNRAITAAYSSLYKERPATFKWCGMAAFASHRIGLALSPYYFVLRNNEIVGVRGGSGSDALEGNVFPDLSLLRETNNAIFEDMAWAHYAYASPNGGISEIEKGLSDVSEPYHLMLDGFKAIHEGETLISQGRQPQGEELIWKGALLLAQHEQFVTAQPKFELIKPHFQIFLSWAASIDFNSRLLEFEFWKFSSFDVYMWTIGLWLLLLSRSLPNICNLRQRWFWISSRVIPLFRKLDVHARASLFPRLSAMIRDAEISAGSDAIESSQRIAVPG